MVEGGVFIVSYVCNKGLNSGNIIKEHLKVKHKSYFNQTYKVWECLQGKGVKKRQRKGLTGKGDSMGQC